MPFGVAKDVLFCESCSGALVHSHETSAYVPGGGLARGEHHNVTVYEHVDDDADCYVEVAVFEDGRQVVGGLDDD